LFDLLENSVDLLSLQWLKEIRWLTTAWHLIASPPSWVLQKSMQIVPPQNTPVQLDISVGRGILFREGSGVNSFSFEKISDVWR
jgi:hypothetical protein